jgi:Gas vesicle synthesis protein GvpO
MDAHQERRGKRLPIDDDEVREEPRRRETAERPRRRESERPAARNDDAPRGRVMPAQDAARAGLVQVADLTGREPQGVVSLEPAGDDGWLVGVEVVEDRRIPSSTDVLALYEAQIDVEGNLLAINRKRRYPRGKSDIGEVGR